MSKKALIDWIEQYARLGHIVIALVIGAGTAIVTVTLAWSNLNHDIMDLKRSQVEEKELRREIADELKITNVNAAIMARNIVRIAEKVGAAVEEPR